MKRAAADGGDGFVQKAEQAPDDARLPLSPEAQEDEIVPGQDRVLDLRDHRLFIPDDARENLFSSLYLPQEVFADLVLDRFGAIPRALEFLESSGFLQRPYLALVWGPFL
jgi:hypothetical protein